jgi:hypothetical protein
MVVSPIIAIESHFRVNFKHSILLVQIPTSVFLEEAGTSPEKSVGSHGRRDPP